MASLSGTSNPEFLSLYSRWRECNQCRLCHGRRRLFEGVGSTDAPVVFILDRQCPLEIEQLKFLVNTTYETIIESIGDFTGRDMTRYWFTPVVACPTSIPPRFGDRPPEVAPPAKTAEVKACSPRVFSEIALIEPELIIACGTQAIRSLFPTDTPSLQYYAGELREAMLPGQHTDYAMPVMLVPSLHQLFVQQEMDPGQLWDKTFQQIALALDIADALRKGA